MDPHKMFVKFLEPIAGESSVRHDRKILSI